MVLILEKIDRGEHALCKSAALVVTCNDKFLKAAQRYAAMIGVTVTDPIRRVSEEGF